MTPGLVAPFFRASVRLGRADRILFERGLPDDALVLRLRASGPILRQNLRRLFAAALLAQSTGAALALVEGFRGNRVVQLRGRDRFVTGSWLFEALLRLLLRRRLIPAPVASFRIDRSRCTVEEAAAVAALARSLGCDGNVTAVADAPCPSAARTERYLRRELRTAVVLTPDQAFARAMVPVTTAQAAFWEALAPRGAERWLAPLVEAPNWGLHFLSDGVGRAFGLRVPFEQRLAHLLRRDRRC
jgi:hypothetical protein